MVGSGWYGPKEKYILFFYLIQPDKWSALPGTHEPSTAFMYSCLYPACYTVTRDKNVVCWYLWKWIICSTFLYSGITDTWSWTYTPVTKVNIYLFIYIISRGEPPLLFHKKNAAAMLRPKDPYAILYTREFSCHYSNFVLMTTDF